jgi:hypothetical protein
MKSTTRALYGRLSETCDACGGTITSVVAGSFVVLKAALATKRF